MNALADPVHLGPGSQAPKWVEDLDLACFGTAWGDLEEGEHLWAASPVAFARWRVLPAIQEAELLRIAVAPGHRRGGLGRELLRHCQDRLARMGVRVLLLEVRVSNLAARTLYEREGWAYQGIRKAYYRDGEDAALYRRELS